MKQNMLYFVRTGLKIRLRKNMVLKKIDVGNSMKCEYANVLKDVPTSMRLTFKMYVEPKEEGDYEKMMAGIKNSMYKKAAENIAASGLFCDKFILDVTTSTAKMRTHKKSYLAADYFMRLKSCDTGKSDIETFSKAICGSVKESLNTYFSVSIKKG